MNEEFLSPLKNIEKVEAPPFLLTRIEARIEARKSQYLSARWAVALGCAFVFILGLNAFVLLNNNSENNSNLSQSLQQELLPANTLYHE